MVYNGLLYVQFMQLLYQHHKDTLYWKYKCDYATNIIFAKQHSPPLPHKFLVFHGVQLHQHFVRWMANIGKNFLGFIDSMHTI